METIVIEPMSANKDLVQSFKVTTIRNNFGIYGQRAIIRLIEASQELLEGRKIGDCVKYQVEASLFGERRVIMPISAILPEGDKNYTTAKAQLKKLTNVPMEYETANGDWSAFTLFSRVDIKQSTGNIILKVEPEIWEAILDFSKGFRRFELNKALQLKSVYSLRLYELLSGQERPLSYSIADLKKMFGLENKYPRPVDFVKRVIMPAKEELDSCAPYSFDFKTILNRPTGKGKPGITGITFYPQYQPKMRDMDLEVHKDFKDIAHKYPHIVELPQGIKNYMMHSLGFSSQGIKNNLELLLEAQKRIDLDQFLRKIAPNANRAKSPQGYTIKAIKMELKEMGITI